MKENGKAITWRASECILGTMEESTKESIKMIRSTGMGSTYGPITGSTWEIGVRESSMGWAAIDRSMTNRLNMGYGKMESE